MRPPSRAIIAILKPPPELAEERVRREAKVLDDEGARCDSPRSPILSSCPAMTSPSGRPSTRKQLMPLARPPRPCAPTGRSPPKSSAWLIHCLVPSITHSSPCRRAVVSMPPGSLPPPTSLSAKAPRVSPPVSRGMVRALLLFGAEGGDDLADHVGHRHRDRSRSARRRRSPSWPGCRRRPQPPRRRARLGDVHAHEAELGELAQDLGRDLPFASIRPREGASRFWAKSRAAFAPSAGSRPAQSPSAELEGDLGGIRAGVRHRHWMMALVTQSRSAAAVCSAVLAPAAITSPPGRM